VPKLTRWYIKTSFVYFIAALVLGLSLAVRQVVDLSALISSLSPVYFHLFLVGWVTELIFGVVYWMFPKLNKKNPRGSESLNWLTYICLNIGLVMRVFGEPINALNPRIGWGWLLVFSAIFQWIAGILFVLNNWGRVK